MTEVMFLNVTLGFHMVTPYKPGLNAELVFKGLPGCRPPLPPQKSKLNKTQIFVYIIL